MSETLVTDREFVARSYEVDATLELKPGVYMNWLQEIAWEGATAAGCPPSWWLEHKRLCVFGANRFDIEKPIRYQDRIIARTWISTMEGSRANREYDMRRASDGKVILRGQSETVMLDYPSLKPADWGEIADRVVPNNESFYNQYEPAAVTPPAEPVTFQATRLIQSDEIDMHRHVNNAVYLRWMADALQSFLSPLVGERAERASIRAAAIRYGSPLVMGQELTVSGKLEGIGEGVSRWSFRMAVSSGARREAKGEMTVRWWPEWTAALKPQAPVP
jgi:acyl-CoA thioesterase FadM